MDVHVGGVRVGGCGCWVKEGVQQLLDDINDEAVCL